MLSNPGPVSTFLAACALACIAIVSTSTEATARTFIVEDTADQGDNDLNDNECKASVSFGTILRRCTFAAAMQQANASNGSDTIILEAKTYRIKQSSLPCNDSAGVIILGAAAGETVLDRDGSTNSMTCTGPIEIRDVTITNGQGPAITTGFSGLLTLDAVFLTNNISSAALHFAGAIQLNSNAVIRNSTFSGNRANGSDARAGAINIINGFVTVENSTFRNNVGLGPQGAGAISLAGQAPLTRLLMRNSTVSGNQGTFGAITAFSGQQFDLLYSTFVSNTPSSVGAGGNVPGSAEGSIFFNTGSAPNCQRNVAPNQNAPRAQNIDSGNTCGFPAATNFINTDPLIDPIGANGGASATHALKDGSPAIDGDTVGLQCPSTDQRGRSRPQDGNSDGVSRCDIGSFERPARFNFPGLNLGVPSLSPGSASVAAGQRLVETFTWEVPAPQNWLALGTLDFRLRDPASGIIFWVRWDQLRDTFVLLNSDGSAIGSRVPTGYSVPLTANGVTLESGATTAQGSGPTGQRVTLSIPLVFDASLAGKTLQIELSAQDDEGRQDPFFAGGQITVSGNNAIADDGPGHGARDKENTKPLTEEGRLQRARTSRLGLGDERTEGDVLRVQCGEGMYEAVIANVDGIVTVKLLHDARELCSSIHPGQYLTVHGEKISEIEFNAHDADIEP